MHGKLAGLAEPHTATRFFTLERSLARVDEEVLPQVLRQSEALETKNAYMALVVVRGHVSPEAKAGGVGFLAAGLVAGVGELCHLWLVRAL